LREVCKNCAFREPDARPEYINYGLCRRNPPTVVAYSNGVDNFVENHWPWVEPENWCGEWLYHAFRERPSRMAALRQDQTP
jgi:hypothetical protein